ncbi:MAG: hypothetical protein MUF75_12300 [Bacteroidia bacterium]|jgi:hypothetical protein|nr:hypothetical protein [Bacteroidia bacterium]
MKLICKIVLEEYGFTQKPENAGPDIIMSKANFELCVKADGTCSYSNMGIEYPVKDLAGLKKLYKEVKSAELQVMKSKAY